MIRPKFSDILSELFILLILVSSVFFFLFLFSSFLVIFAHGSQDDIDTLIDMAKWMFYLMAGSFVVRTIFLEPVRNFFNR